MSIEMRDCRFVGDFRPIEVGEQVRLEGYLIAPKEDYWAVPKPRQLLRALSRRLQRFASCA